MSIKPPSSLFRYRPVGDDATLARELSAIRDSYLYAPLFSQMNDPMEAFYETGGPIDAVIEALFPNPGHKLQELYTMLADLVGKFALVSFSSTPKDLPLWAYYASNFAGMCLEFDTAKLGIGGFKNEKLRPVTYASDALPPLTVADLTKSNMDALIARITRKRLEWAHEKEWRYVVGEAGPRYYLDSALRRIFLGPRMPAEHAQAVRDAVQHRDVEVVQGRIQGYILSFAVVQPPTPLKDCARIGEGHFDPDEHRFSYDALNNVLSVPLDSLWEACRELCTDPNLDRIEDVGYSSSRPGNIFVQATYRLRKGPRVYQNHYFDAEARPVPGDVS